MATSVKEFLETYPLYQTFRPGAALAWWNGDWPDVVNMRCRTCGEGSHRIWPTKLVGFTLEWGVFMISGTCERCGTDRVMFWVEVNQRDGWMRKAGQLPATAVDGSEARVS